MTLAIATIADSISQLTVTGVNIKDLDQIPPDATRLTPVLFPEPLGFVTDFTLTRESQGSNTFLAKYTVTYRLHYTFLHSPIGSARILDLYDDMVGKAFAILDKIIDNDAITGAVDIQPAEAIEFGPVPDPAGNMYHGCRFVLQVMEFVN
jgi:hypothetical protein